MQGNGDETERRTALIIGNAAYENAPGEKKEKIIFPPLKHPVWDARDRTTALQRLGFTVTSVLNGNKRAMEDSIEALSQQLRQGGVGLLYFSGHGISSMPVVVIPSPGRFWSSQQQG